MQLLHGTTNLAARQILDAVPPVMWFIRRYMRRHRKGLSVTQFRTLFVVDRKPAASLSVVAEHLGASLPTTSRIVTGLVDKGFLTRHGCCDDRRQLALAITSRGRTVLDEAWSATHTQLETALAGLEPADHTILIQAMEILKTRFGAVDMPPALDKESRTGENYRRPDAVIHR